MSCFYCWDEGITTDEKGSCGYAGCTLDICTPPSARFDGDFHGEICGCGCGALMCERHLGAHASEEHGRSDPGGCFPALWARVSGAGLGGASALLAARGAGGGEPRACNRFLNAVLPHDSLLRMAAGLPSGLATVESIPGGARVRFSREFYVPATLERTAALAVRELKQAAAGLHANPERTEWLRRGRRSRGAIERAQEVVRGWLRDSGIVRPHFEIETTAPRIPEIVMGNPRVSRKTVNAVRRHPEVDGLSRGELATWIAAPHAEGTDATERRGIPIEA